MQIWRRGSYNSSGNLIFKGRTSRTTHIYIISRFCKKKKTRKFASTFW